MCGGAPAYGGTLRCPAGQEKASFVWERFDRMPKTVLVFLAGLLAVAAADAQIVLRIAVRNPSSLQENEVKVKKLLPEGIEPEHVIDAAGLEVVYDELAERYCVQKRITLGPLETAEFAVRLEDIWLIDEEELRAIDDRAEQIAKTLEGKRFEAEAGRLRDRVHRNVEAILARQEAAKIPDATVPEHISAYDHNEVLFRVVREDATTLEEMLAVLGHGQILQKVPPGMPPNVGTIWKVILIIISLVGVMTLAFFLIWSSQLRRIREAERESGLA